MKQHMKEKAKSKDYPNDVFICLIHPCGKSERKLESSVLSIVHGWSPHEIRVVQGNRVVREN